MKRHNETSPVHSLNAMTMIELFVSNCAGITKAPVLHQTVSDQGPIFILFLLIQVKFIGGLLIKIGSQNAKEIADGRLLTSA